jgi:hypothetical protein
VVGIAVSDVRLVACGELSLDLIANVVIASGRGVLNVNVREELVELCDIGVKNGLELSLAHGMIEGNGNFTSVITNLGNIPSSLLGLTLAAKTEHIARCKSKDVGKHAYDEENG